MLGDFYGSCQLGLLEKLGCVLFQLPPNLVYSKELMQKIIANLDPHFENVVEFRHPSWWNKLVIQELKKKVLFFAELVIPACLMTL